jgi:hypothetical protein
MKERQVVRISGGWNITVSCPLAGFGIGGVELSGSTARDLVIRRTNHDESVPFQNRTGCFLREYETVEDTVTLHVTSGVRSLIVEIVRSLDGRNCGSSHSFRLASWGRLFLAASGLFRLSLPSCSRRFVMLTCIFRRTNLASGIQLNCFVF